MKPFAQIFATVFDREPQSREAAQRRQMHRDWDRQRARAISPSDLAEIDAIFSRNL